MATASFDWSEYLTLATNLSTNADAASQRTSVSRAYYAAFHAATLHAQLNGYAERNHGRLWKMYATDADANARRISALGNQMKSARERADYEAVVPRIDDIMAQQLEDANRFVALLANLPPSSPQLLPPNLPKTCNNCGAVVS